MLKLMHFYNVFLVNISILRRKCLIERSFVFEEALNIGYGTWHVGIHNYGIRFDFILGFYISL